MSAADRTGILARPGWRALAAMLVVAMLVYIRAGLGFAMVAGLLSLISTGVWRAVALLGYLATSTTTEDDDEEDDGE